MDFPMQARKILSARNMYRRHIMMNQPFTTSKERSKVTSQATAQVEAEVSKVGVGVIGFVAALIGIWGLSCFVGGLVNSGGPLAFVKGWFGAVLGL